MLWNRYYCCPPFYRWENWGTEWLLFLQTRYTVLAQNMKRTKHVLNYSASSENEGYCISEFPGNSNTALELWGGHLFSSYTILPS